MSTKLRTLAKVPQPVPKLAPNGLVLLREVEADVPQASQLTETCVLKEVRVGNAMATHLVQEGFLEVSMTEECRKNPTGIRPRSVLRLDGQCCMCTRHTQAPCGRMDEACEQMQRFSWFHGQVYIQFLHTRPKDHAGKQLGALILEKGIVEHQAEETRRAQARLGSCQPGWRLGWGAWDKVFGMNPANLPR